MRDFTEDPNEDISGNQGFRAREASYPYFYASRGRDSSYFGLFSTLGGYLGWILGLLGMLPCFDPKQCPEFGTGFWWGNGGNLDLCSL